MKGDEMMDDDSDDEAADVAMSASGDAGEEGAVGAGAALVEPLEDLEPVDAEAGEPEEEWYGDDIQFEIPNTKKKVRVGFPSVSIF